MSLLIIIININILKIKYIKPKNSKIQKLFLKKKKKKKWGLGVAAGGPKATP
jgi:hypothetical protein